MPHASIVDKARKYIANGNIKEAIDVLLADLKDLPLSESLIYQMQNDFLLLRSKFVRLDCEKRKHMIGYEEYDLQCNSISNSMLGLLSQLDIAIGSSSSEQPKSDAGCLHKVELILDMDFENATDEEINAVLYKISLILKTRPNELKIKTKEKGSVILKMELSANTFIRLKSLARTGIVKELKDVRNIGEDGWEWIVNTEFALTLEGVALFEANLYGADLHLHGSDLRGADLRSANFRGTDLRGVDLRSANLKGADLIGANLSGANLSGADFSNAVLRGADLIGANLSGDDLSGADLRNSGLIGTNLIGTNLIGTDLRGANLIGAWTENANLSNANLVSAFLTGADLRGADKEGAYLSDADAYLRGGDLRGGDLPFESIQHELRRRQMAFHHVFFFKTKLSGTIFHKKHRELLESTREDISNVIFVDDDEKNIENIVTVE